MNIYALKIQFEQTVQPAPSHALIGAEQAWKYFEAAILQRLDDVLCEEFGFSMSAASYFDGAHVHMDENLFQVYFGRLIDAEKGQPWHTAEINFYYRYEMNARLRLLLSELRQQDIETAFCSSEDEKIICQKVDTVFAFANERRLIWDEIRDLKPVQSSFHFWIQ